MKAKYKHSYVGNMQWQNEHVLIAESVLGRPLPKGAEVHHVDENKFNNSHSNLVICPSRGYHMMLHQRKRSLEACGNADWLRCRFCKEYDDPQNLHITPKLNHGGKNIHHRKCDAEYARKRRLGN